jgi:hypothetical protein
MMRRLYQQGLARAGAELLADVVLYLAATVVVMLVLDQLIRLAAGGS